MAHAVVLPSGAAPSPVALESRCLTVEPLDTTGWHAHRALDATGWHIRAPQTRRPGVRVARRPGTVATATPARVSRRQETCEPRGEAWLRSRPQGRRRGLAQQLEGVSLAYP